VTDGAGRSECPLSDWYILWHMALMTRRGFTFSLAGALAAQDRDPDNVAWLSLAEASARIQSRAVTPTQLLRACFARIDTYNPKLNAFITVIRDRALAQAQQLEIEQRAGKLRGPLHGPCSAEGQH
jgi:aspartyl-tRNA(Asn)/glutamyl-tRNA(Gln) amidotransferase subunit A